MQKGVRAAGFEPAVSGSASSSPLICRALESRCEQGSAKKGKKGKDAAAEGASESWSQRTHKMYVMLGKGFAESDDMPLSYDAMIGQTKDGAAKRKIVAGCFQELLFLTTKGLIELEQGKPYSDIIVSKTDAFDSVAAH